MEDQLRYLPSKTRAIFRMNRYDNKSVREIAANLHLTEKAVEYHITRALKFLRKKLKGYLPLLFKILFR
ncbi:MAG: sigma factor-like helix-turn-helix DNA-binding protein [Bacteroidota bacterium]